LNINHLATNTTIDMQPNVVSVPAQWGIPIQPGINYLSCIHGPSGIADEMVIMLACVTTDEIEVTLPISTMDTLCLQLDELPGIANEFIEICNGGLGNNVLLEQIPGTYCLVMEGYTVDISETCVVICDDFGFC